MNYLRNKIYQLLRKSEVVFKTDMVYLAKGGFWLTLVQVVGGISAFILSITFANLLPKDAYGTYKYVLALAGIIGTLTLTGLGPAITQSVARGYDSALKKGSKIVLRWGIIIVIVSFGMSVYYILHGNYLLAFSLFLIGISSPIVDALSFFSSYLVGKKEFKTLSILNTLGNTVPAAGLILVILLTRNILVIIFVYFLLTTLTILFSYRYTLARFKPHGPEDPEMLSYARHMTLITFLNTIADQIDKVIVYHYVGAVELAVYVFATAVPTQIKGVLKTFFPLALPKFANYPLESVRREAPKKMLILFIVIIAIVGSYVIAAPYVYKIFFPKYLEAVRMSQIFSLSLLAYISIIPSTVLQAKKTIKSLYGSNISIAVSKLILLFVGVKLAGVWGVILARIAYEYVGLVIVYVYMRRAEEPTYIL